MTSEQFHKDMSAGPSMRSVWMLVVLVGVLTILTVLTALWQTTQADRRDAVHTCTSFKNQRAIEDTLLEIAAVAGVEPLPEARVVATPGTRSACRRAGTPMK